MDNSTITTISIRNFKGIEDLQLNAKKLNAIIGKCGSGKSSLLDAIRFALTGKAGKEVIRKGCREASVVLRFSDNSTIERIRRTSENISKCNGKSSTKRSLDEFLTARNMNPCWIESLCSVDWFAGLSSKDLNNFFMTILPLRAKAETVVELVAQLDKDLTEKKEKYLMEEILKKQEIFSFNDLANGYNTAYTVRQELKRKYNEMLPRCTFNETVPAKTREDIEKELNNISQVEAAEKEYSKRLKEYASSKKQHDLAIKRLDEMKKELDTYSSCKKPKEETKAQAEADRKLFQVHIKRTNEYIGTINSTLDLLKRTLDNLDKPICPISEKLICTTDKSQLKEELLSLIQKNENNGHTWTSLNDFAKAVNRTIIRTGDDSNNIELTSVLSVFYQTRELFCKSNKKNSIVYNRKIYDAENNAVENIIRLTSNREKIPFDARLIRKSEKACGMSYGKQQREAFPKILESKGIKILTGGPGTGKTTTIKGIILAYQEMHPKDVVKLCAPTGRAAQRMAESTEMPACTVHRLLNYTPYGEDANFKDASDPIDADLIVVDEVSMLDISLFSMLIDAIKTGATLVLVGDIHQLESVGPGAVLHDLLDINDKFIPKCMLIKKIRQLQQQ